MKIKIEEHLQLVQGKNGKYIPKWVQDYLLKHKDDLGLSDGYVKCDGCNGKGYNSFLVPDIEPFGKRRFKWERKTCDKCAGVGKLNWLENLFGKKKIIQDDDEDCDQQGP